MLKNKSFYGDIYYKCKIYNSKIYSIIESMCDEMTQDNYTFGVYLDKYTDENGYELMISPRNLWDTFRVREEWYRENIYDCDECKTIDDTTCHRGDIDIILCDKCYAKNDDKKCWWCNATGCDTINKNGVAIHSSCE